MRFKIISMNDKEIKQPIDSIQYASTNVLLKNVPAEVNKLIRKEQLRLEVDEGVKLKKPAVAIQMLEQWGMQREEIKYLNKQLELILKK